MVVWRIDQDAPNWGQVDANPKLSDGSSILQSDSRRRADLAPMVA